jgi:hypothetical protein
VSKIHGLSVLYGGFECKRPEVFCKHFRKWDRSWRYRRSGDCTTATNDGSPKEP